MGAAIICLLYLKHPTALAPAVASLLQTADWPAAAQLLHVLNKRHGGPGQLPLPARIRQALLHRTREQQTAAYAEPELFAHLAHLAPDALTETAWDELWPEWLADARVALADALGRMVFPNSEARTRAVRLLLSLTKDAVYAVRRSAYRGLVQAEPSFFEKTCAGWSYQEAPLEVRRRAAEACGWLPLPDEEQPAMFDDVYSSLATDPEISVRQAARDARRSRRGRLWAEEYLARVRAVDGLGSDDVLAAWRYGKALAQVGDDTCLHTLRVDLAERSLAPHVRFWLEQIVDKLEAQWRKVTQKWPEPWLTWTGQVREGRAAVVRSPGGREFQAHYSLWCEPARVPSELHSWGGALSGLDPFWVDEINGFTLRLEDGTEGEAVVKHVSGNIVIFVGIGPYPV